MTIVSSDVDIDVFNRDAILEKLDYVNAKIDREGVAEKHVTGVYFQNMPRDPNLNLAIIDHKAADKYGYFKIDFLNVNLYKDIKNEEHLLILLNRAPQWEYFQFTEITDMLFHLNGYSHLLQRFNPQSVEDLAMILAIIRPAKAYLQDATWEKIRKEVWDKTLDKGAYAFKRAHGIAYSLTIIVHLNLIIERLQT